jgi:hypothetical protein
MLDKRKKTTILVSKTLVSHVEYAARQMGIGKNSFFSMGVAFLLVHLGRLLPGKKRADILKDVDKEFQKLMSDVKKR